MKNIVVAAALCVTATCALAAQAYLVRQTIGRSVTGQPIIICTYQYGRQPFERYYPMGSTCPMSVEVQ